MIRSALIASLAMIPMTLSNVAVAKPLKATPLGKADAPVGGTMYRNLGPEPDTFNPLNSKSAYASEIQGYVLEGLLMRNLETHALEPMIAEEYEASKDFLTYTFKLNPAAKFSDGTPVTAEDVKFSLEYVKDPRYLAAPKIPYFENIDSVTAPDPRTVVVKMKKRYFMNLDVAATSAILPKHVFEDPKAKFPVSPVVGSGSYKIESYSRGKNIVLVRDKNWWGLSLPHLKGTAKFERINYRFIAEDNLALEMLKKSQLDYLEPRPEVYETRAVGEPFGTTIKKYQVENKLIKRYGFIGWNYLDPGNPKQPHPILADRDVRRALSMLLNRKLLIEKFMYNKSVEGRGPVSYNSPLMPKDVKPISFDPKQAKALLKKAGWADTDQDGVLDKVVGGTKRDFRVTLLLPNRDVEKYFTIYKEDLRQAGVVLDIKLIEWSSFTKLLDEQKFDAVTMAWASGGVEDDLKQIWHSSSAAGGGSNFISYKNPKVDELIDKAREEMVDAKRFPLWQQVVRLIADDAAYTYLFNPKYDLYLLNKRIGFEKPVYPYGSGQAYWWINP